MAGIGISWGRLKTVGLDLTSPQSDAINLQGLKHSLGGWFQHSAETHSYLLI